MKKTARQFEVVSVADVLLKAQLLEDDEPAVNSLTGEADPLPSAPEYLSIAGKTQDGEK